jgi:hypothetical protein
MHSSASWIAGPHGVAESASASSASIGNIEANDVQNVLLLQIAAKSAGRLQRGR